MNSQLGFKLLPVKYFPFFPSTLFLYGHSLTFNDLSYNLFVFLLYDARK